MTTTSAITAMDDEKRTSVPSSSKELVSMRRAAVNFHGRLTDKLPVVRDLSLVDLQFRSVEGVMTAVMVGLELVIGVMSGPSVTTAVFDGPARDDQTIVSVGEGTSDERRTAWEQVWGVRAYTISFSGRLNHCLFYADPFGARQVEVRVMTALQIAMRNFIEVIGGLRVPVEFLDRVR
jgi:hypothetical protein